MIFRFKPNGGRNGRFSRPMASKLVVIRYILVQQNGVAVLPVNKEIIIMYIDMVREFLLFRVLSLTRIVYI